MPSGSTGAMATTPASTLTSTCGQFASVRIAWLEGPEIYFDRPRARDGLAVFIAGLELPLLYSFDRLFVQAQTEATRDFDVGGLAAGIDFDVQQHGALVFGLA